MPKPRQKQAGSDQAAQRRQPPFRATADPASGQRQPECDTDNKHERDFPQADDHEPGRLARSDTAAATLTAAGATPHRGSVQDLASVRAGAAKADGAIHTAFFHEFSHASLSTRMRVITGGSPRKIVDRFLAATLAADRAAIEAIGTSLNGSDRPLVATFATMALTPGQLGTEAHAVNPDAVGGPRGGTERTMGELATHGVRSAVVRLPPVVHGDGDRGGSFRR